jgi:hypothetical protein
VQVLVPGGSHCSPALVVTTPSPQNCWIVQMLEHTFLLGSLASLASHCSPSAGSNVPFPQTASNLQIDEQPSPDWLFPSSHCSPGSSCPTGPFTPLALPQYS